MGSVSEQKIIKRKNAKRLWIFFNGQHPQQLVEYKLKLFSDLIPFQ